MSDDLLKKDMVRKLLDDHNEAAKRVTMSLMFSPGIANEVVILAAANHFVTVSASAFAQAGGEQGEDAAIYNFTGELARDIINARDMMKAALNDPVQRAKIIDDLRKTFGDRYGRG